VVLKRCAGIFAPLLLALVLAAAAPWLQSTAAAQQTATPTPVTSTAAEQMPTATAAPTATQTSLAAITLVNGNLFIQLPGQPKVQLHPESQTDFLLCAADFQCSFQVDELLWMVHV
jgi:hypothetical protein